MAKAPDSRYEAGSRGAAWLKIKVAHTLDLVVLAAEWGSGRRARLAQQSASRRARSRGRLRHARQDIQGPDRRAARVADREVEGARASIRAARGYVVEVRPELVVEIAFNELQASRRYPGGLALRFARVVRYRPDKRPEDADTIDTVRAIAAAQRGARASRAPRAREGAREAEERSASGIIERVMVTSSLTHRATPDRRRRRIARVVGMRRRCNVVLIRVLPRAAVFCKECASRCRRCVVACRLHGLRPPQSQGHFAEDRAMKIQDVMTADVSFVRPDTQSWKSLAKCATATSARCRSSTTTGSSAW